MRRQLPPLNALRAFDAAAEAGNFTEAGRRLNVSQGAISRHVAQLEDFLGMPLFERNGARVRLTDEGADYALMIHGAFDRIEEATRAHIALHQRRSLRLKLFPTAAMKWLISRLSRFHALHPSIDVQITTTSSMVSLDGDDVDFTIQTSNAPAVGIGYDRLFEIALVPVCSPDYLGRIAPPGDAEQLPGCTLLHSMKRPDDWHTWFRAAGVAPGKLHAGLTFGNSSLAYQGAADGAGIAIAHTAFVRDDVAAGRLVVCHPLVVRTGQHYYLAGRRDRETVAAKTFRTWIIDEAQADERTAGGDPGRPEKR
ncbi:MAG TPA: LysR substrate-binding domain-containing protein [Rhodopila sp.]